MNTLYDIRVAHKYAQAFLATYAHVLQEVDIEYIHQAGIFLKNNIEAKSILAMPVQEKVQEKLIEILCKTFELSDAVKRLLQVLAEKNRLHLVTEIFMHIAKLYGKAHSIETVVIKSSIELSSVAKGHIIHFLGKKIGKKIKPVFIVDKKLLSGIRIQGDSFLWEYSVRKQLNAIPTLLMRSEGAYGN